MKSDAGLIGQRFIEHGLLSTDQLQVALHEQKNVRQPLGQLLVELGFVSEHKLREILCARTGKQAIELTQVTPTPQALSMIAAETARQLKVLPLRWDAAQRTLSIACEDTDDVLMQDKLRQHLPPGSHLDCQLASTAQLSVALDEHYGFKLEIDGILAELENHHREPGSVQDTQALVRLIDALLADAIRHGASDIHFEPEKSFVRIRYRIDGLLRQIRVLHKSSWPAMVVRLKVMASLNIAETRAPQDGRISLRLSGRDIDLRIASQPTLHGENLSLRILDRQKGIVPLDQLGLANDQLATLQRMLARPEGIILLCGPTGSGKTTTLYSILQHIEHEGINIMTLEDPVEYPMARVRQTSVSDACKLDFANGIRAMMRQDPDVILVGEIRDSDTAVMALRAAMTGHQVFSTLHSNSAIGVIPRLLDLGILPDLLAGNIIGVLAQRLLRKLCPHCATRRPAKPGERQILGLTETDLSPELAEPVGCAHCAYQGYRGRLAIMELLHVNAEIDDLICRRASHREIQQVAASQGMRSLADDGLRRVLAGETSLAELARVVDLSPRTAGRMH